VGEGDGPDVESVHMKVKTAKSGFLEGAGGTSDRGDYVIRPTPNGEGTHA
jgi:hypothetical protein